MGFEGIKTRTFMAKKKVIQKMCWETTEEDIAAMKRAMEVVKRGECETVEVVSAQLRAELLRMKRSGSRKWK
jgi:hypothetical protein